MKKLFTTLLLVLSVFMLSSCIIIGWDYYDYDYGGEYDFYLYNKTDYTIRDQYLIDEDDVVYKPRYRTVHSGSHEKIRNLPEGYYIVRFQVGSYDAEWSDWFYLDIDKKITVRDYSDWDSITNY